MIQRGFTWSARLDANRAATAPFNPVVEILAAERVGPEGARTSIDVRSWSFERGARNSLVRADAHHRGRIDVTITAGFGLAWADTPADLRRATELLAVHFLGSTRTSRPMLILPDDVRNLIGPWRRLQP